MQSGVSTKNRRERERHTHSRKTRSVEMRALLSCRVVRLMCRHPRARCGLYIRGAGERVVCPPPLMPPKTSLVARGYRGKVSESSFSTIFPRSVPRRRRTAGSGGSRHCAQRMPSYRMVGSHNKRGDGHLVFVP